MMALQRIIMRRVLKSLRLGKRRFWEGYRGCQCRRGYLELTGSEGYAL
jgi:hypothetical protein